MNTLPVAGSTTWLPEIPSLSVTQSWIAAPAQSPVRALTFVLTTGRKWVPSVETVSTSWLPPLAEVLVAS